MADVLVTGSRGLIGHSLMRALALAGHGAQGFDWSYPQGHRHFGNLLDRASLDKACRACDGIVHLAAISRVAWGERDPRLCHAVNGAGTRDLLAAATRSPRRPWVIIASSREVYGEPATLPVAEDAPLLPANHYGQSKLATEHAALAMADRLRIAILRFANVYGSSRDHGDRVVPAFIDAALRGRRLQVHGPDNSFDFTHVDDVVRGIMLAVERLRTDAVSLPPLHFASGRATRLGDLARLVVDLTQSGSAIEEVAGRAGFVSRFVGDPTRAAAVLGFRCQVSLEAGLMQLAHAMAEPADRRHADFPVWLDAAVA